MLRPSTPRWPAALVLAFAACGEPPATRPPAPPPVRVVEVTLETRPPVVWVTAPIQASRRATLRAEATGRVVEAPFQRGSVVPEGAVIVRLSAPRSENAVSEARASVEQLEIGLRQATRQREHAEALAADNASTSSALDAARDREAEARAQLEAAQARARSARTGIEEAVVRAPFSGVLASYSVNVGESLRPGADVAVLVDPSGLEAELLIDPAEARHVEEGGEVRITTRALPDDTFVGHVTLVSEVLDPRSRRLPVRVAVEDPEHRLLPGGFAEFAVPVGAPRLVALLPERAVVHRLGRDQVFVVGADDVAEVRDVTLGATRRAEVEVTDGLAAGERAVVAGNERVVDGEAVHVVVDEDP